MARGLAESIASLDRQVAGLGRAFDPAETKRLADRLAALGPDQGQADENLEIREILRKQLEPVRGLEVRIEDAKARRGRLFDFLKGLRLHLAELQTGSGDSAKAARATDCMQELLERIGAQHAVPKTLGDPNADTHPLRDAPTIER